MVSIGACTSAPPAVDTPYRRSGPTPEVTSVGHATFLLELEGRLLLTDPWFYEGPLTGVHPEGLGMSPPRMPLPDLIVITHAHRDHFDQRFLEALGGKHVPIVVPKAMERSVRALGFARVIAIDSWEIVELRSLRITATPAVHQGPTNAYVIESPQRVVYFASETIFFDGLRQVAERFPRIDVAFLPADGLRLRWGTRLAMTPDEAVQALAILRPRVAIPILDHDFSRSIAGVAVTTAGTAEEFRELAARGGSAC